MGGWSLRVVLEKELATDCVAFKEVQAEFGCQCLGSRFELEFEIVGLGWDRVWAESRFEVEFLRL